MKILFFVCVLLFSLFIIGFILDISNFYIFDKDYFIFFDFILDVFFIDLILGCGILVLMESLMRNDIVM